jgi:hypothetical protein
MKYKVNDKVRLIKDINDTLIGFRAGDIGKITSYPSLKRTEKVYKIKFSDSGHSYGLIISESEMDNYFTPLSKTKLKIKIQELQGDTSKVKMNKICNYIREKEIKIDELKEFTLIKKYKIWEVL